MQIQECVVAILDSTIDQDAGVIHHEVLEVDDKGNTPNSNRFECPSQHSIDLVVKNPDQLKVNIFRCTKCELICFNLRQFIRMKASYLL